MDDKVKPRCRIDLAKMSVEEIAGPLTEKVSFESQHQVGVYRCKKFMGSKTSTISRTNITWATNTDYTITQICAVTSAE